MNRRTVKPPEEYVDNVLLARAWDEYRTRAAALSTADSDVNVVYLHKLGDYFERKIA